MPNADSASLFEDLDAALQSGSSEKRAAMLRQITDLHLSGADRLNETQIAVFDRVLVQLIEKTEARALAEISDYQSRLKSLTGGEGTFTMDLSHYDPVPARKQPRATRKAASAKKPG